MSKKYPPPDRPTNIHGRILAARNLAETRARAQASAVSNSSTFAQLLHVELEAQRKTIQDLERRLKKCSHISPQTTPRAVETKPRVEPKPRNVAADILKGSGEALDRSEALTQAFQEPSPPRPKSLKALLESLADA